MISPERLEQLPKPALALWQQVEEDILQDMAQRIAQAGKLTDIAAWQARRLEVMRLFRRDVVRRLSQALGKSEAEVREMLAKAGTETLASDDTVYKAAGLKPISPNDSPALRNLLAAGARQTQGTLVNLTATTADLATAQLGQSLDRAWLQVSSGAFDYQTAIRRSVRDLADRGLEAVHYPATGHTDTLEVAVRRALLTGVNQTAARLQIARMDEMGVDLVETTAHYGARPEHAAWQGCIFSRSGKHPKYPDFVKSTGYGTGRGLCGWNCRHNFHPFCDGISEPLYTAGRLQQMEAKEIRYKERDYTRYEVSQMQRELERRIRKWKRRTLMEKSAGLDAEKSEQRLETAKQDLVQFVIDINGKEDPFRTYVHGFDPEED